MVNEANQIAEVLQKPVKFEVKLAIKDENRVGHRGRLLFVARLSQTPADLCALSLRSRAADQERSEHFRRGDRHCDGDLNGQCEPLALGS